MLGDKYPVAVLGREHRAGVEAQPVWRDVPPLVQCRGTELTACAPRPVFRIGRIALMAEGKAEVKSGFRRVIQFAGRQVIAHHVAAVIVEPQLLRCRIPIEANGVAHAARKHLKLTAIRFESVDGGVHIRIRCADVARRADRHVEPAIRTEGDELPAVMAVPGQFVEYDDWLWRGLQIGFDLIEAQDAADFGHVQRTIANGYTVRRVQAPGDGDDLVHLAVPICIHQRMDRAFRARAHEHRAPGAQRQRARVFDALRIDLDLEAGRQPEALDGRGGRGQFGRRCGDQQQHRDGDFHRLTSAQTGDRNAKETLKPGSRFRHDP